jgi:predicted MPP superfamily phosphohydrolase
VTLFLLAIPAVAGWWLAARPHLPWYMRHAFPLLVLAVWLLGDLRLLVQKRLQRGAPPVDEQPPRPRGFAYLRHPITTTDLTRVTYEVFWDGPALTVAQLTDIHVNGSLPLSHYHEAIRLAEQAQPDLVLLTGDFVSHAKNIPTLPGLLTNITTTCALSGEGLTPGKAVFASLGNHDYWSDPTGVKAALAQSGVRLLSGQCMELFAQGQPFRLCADDRPWGPASPFSRGEKGQDSPPPSGEGLGVREKTHHTLDPKNLGDSIHLPHPQPFSRGEKGQDSPPPSGEGLGVREKPTLILSHSPDNIFDLRYIPGAVAVFSGHVHGGQFRVPLPFGSTSLVLPSIHGRRLDRGHFVFVGAEKQPVHLFVSAGVGADEPALRLYCPPEVLIVRFISTNNSRLNSDV